MPAVMVDAGFGRKERMRDRMLDASVLSRQLDFRCPHPLTTFHLEYII